MSEPASTRLRDLFRPSALLFLSVWFISAAYLGCNLNRGWVPHDEGILGESAERVLHGELPHRDFDEPYTGGLAYLDAAAFRLFGVNLMVLRWALFGFFLLWVPAVFAIAHEFCAPPAVPWPAAAVTLLSVAWSVPNYPAAMPSWYCLFLATFGTLALLRYLRSPHPAWLFAAGLSGGLSFLIKTPGACFIAAVLLFLLYHEQFLSRAPGISPALRRPRLYFVFVLFGLVLFLILLFRISLRGGGLAEFLHFVLPALAIVGLLLYRELTLVFASSPARVRSFLFLVTPFLAGVVLPVAIFCFFYWRSGALAPLFHGLFVLQLSRLADARMPPPHWIFLLGAIPLLLFLLAKYSPSRVLRAAILSAAALLFCAALSSTTLLLVEYNSLRAAFPLFVVVALLALLQRERSASATIADRRLVLLLCVSTLCSLVQVPYAGPLYFCYFAALAFLALAAFLSLRPAPLHARFNLALALAFFLVFAVVAFRPISIAAFELERRPRLPDTPLALPRAGGLRVFPDQAKDYGALIPFVVSHSSGAQILAAPDCPEVYFLSGLSNPTPFFFDFFRDPAAYRRQLEPLLVRADGPASIRVVVVNNDPRFSFPQLIVLRSLVTPRFPQSRKFANFEVFWR